MSQKESFGLRMRAARERRGITLQAIAERTKVSTVLWQAMERNDFSKWPWGLFARSYIRDYAVIVGVNADEAVEEFCRYFPNGDRRRENVLRAHADTVGTPSQYTEDRLPPQGDRRASRPVNRQWTFPGGDRGKRVLGATADVAIVCAAAVGAAHFLPGAFFPALGIAAVLYFGIGGALTGRSPGIAMANLLGRRVPELLPARPERPRIEAVR